MNPLELDATGLLLWGLVAHLVADWLLQNEWMAVNKPNLWHPAGYVHAGIHAVAMAPVFGLVSLLLAVVHLLVDTRVPVAWWSRLMRQTMPTARVVWARDASDDGRAIKAPLFDLGMLVRMANDQVWHVVAIAVAALAVAA